MRIGSVTLRIVSGNRDGDDQPGPGPNTHRYATRQPLPGVMIEGVGPKGKPSRWSVDRVLTLVGRSPLCKLRLSALDDPLFACALMRTPRGLWLVDLGEGRRVAVNGAICRETRLEDGDLVRIGTRAFRIYYDGTTTPPNRQVPFASERSGIIGMYPPVSALGQGSAPALPVADLAPIETHPQTVFQPLIDCEGPIPDVASAPFMQALSMLVRLFGDLQRSHLDLVRDELEQIRQIGREMAAHKNATKTPKQGPRTTSRNPIHDDPRVAFNDFDENQFDSDTLESDRPDPKLVHDIVGDRLTAWESERQSRWRKVVDLLVKH